MGGHSRFLVQELGLTKEEVEAARIGQDVDVLTEREKALVRFARRVAEAPRQINEDDISTLRDVGLDDATIVEALSICLMSAWTNTFADTLKFDADLEAFGMLEEYF
jgi:alkylhydroperoxidase family enzyme